MIPGRNRRGKFLKHCPCSPDSISCGYFNINLIEGCPYHCSYCILNSYLDNKNPVFYVNWNDAVCELKDLAARESFLRVGSGELADSLALDRETSHSTHMVEFMRRFPRVVFELKTKSTRIERLLALDKAPENAVISWSLNPPEMIGKEEVGTPGLDQRLKSLHRVQEKGFMIGLHFDPLILVSGWRQMYQRLLESVSRVVKPERVAWISMGALRFPTELRAHILRCRDSDLMWGELVRGPGNKYRYFKPIRLEMFSQLKRYIHQYISSDVPTYLCMESVDVWREILPEISPGEPEINEMLYRSVFERR